MPKAQTVQRTEADVPKRTKAQWLQFLWKKPRRLRAGCKQTVNTKTYKISTLPTIEMWLPAQRRYLPLRMWDGRWFFKTCEERDRMLELLEKRPATASLRSCAGASGGAA